jgi:hypothetical protein
MEGQESMGSEGACDELAATALVVRTVRDIESATDESRDLLLGDLLCAAWPTRQAQFQ